MKKRIFVLLSTIILVMFISTSCKKDDQGKIDRDLIEAYVLENNLDGQFTESGLYYIISEPGGNDHPNVYSRVSVYYKGYKLDGTVFDEHLESEADPVTFGLYSVITGWQEGLQLIGRKGRIKLIIPSGLAYGQSGQGSIGPNEILVFDIYLDGFDNN